MIVHKLFSGHAYTYIGCYEDDSDRDLSFRGIRNNSMTRRMCHDHCQGLAYFGVQVSGSLTVNIGRLTPLLPRATIADLSFPNLKESFKKFN